MRKVKSLAELRSLARRDPRYEHLAMLAALNLGGSACSLEDALRTLYINASETAGEPGGGEDGVVGEVNGCLQLMKGTK